MDLKDVAGKFFIKTAIEKCKKTGHAKEEYKWLITKANKVESRTLLVDVVDCGGKKVDVGISYMGKL